MISDLSLELIVYEVIKLPDEEKFHPVFYVKLEVLQIQLHREGFHSRLVRP